MQSFLIYGTYNRNYLYNLKFKTQTLKQYNALNGAHVDEQHVLPFLSLIYCKEILSEGTFRQ